LRAVLQEAGLWTELERDAAGRIVLDAACLRQPAARSLSGLTERLSQDAFVRWLTQVLEAGIFEPPPPPSADVIILPLAQLLGRSPAAVVFPGADESAFKLVPDRAGPWTVAQRVALGLATRAETAAQTEAAWHSALRAPVVDVVWRTSQRGETVMASPLVLARLLAGAEQGEDPRSLRNLQPRPGGMPGPGGQALPLARLSASAYADLRQCPYRYFAGRLLNLDSADEIDEELDKRDFGQWIHAVLADFHRALALDPEASRPTRQVLADAAAEQAMQVLRFSDAEFLPYRASWPEVREAYLDWLAGHEKAGHRFVAGELARERRLDGVVLHGRLDRVDRASDGGLVLLDYKTESRQRAADRVKIGSEDVQLPFYAALLEQPPRSASYLSIAEGAVHAHAHEDIEAASARLVQGLQSDLLRIAAGAPLKALGVGQACTYCRSRGLCRKDSWAATGEGSSDV
jgi:ATP-dependent helicase/nuclease subunit B